MMAQRAWPLGSDLAGVGTAMITTRAVPALLPANIGMSQIGQIATGQDFADPLGWSPRMVQRASDRSVYLFIGALGVNIRICREEGILPIPGRHGRDERCLTRVCV